MEDRAPTLTSPTTGDMERSGRRRATEEEVASIDLGSGRALCV
jgi:hypothetical protein